MVTPSTRPSLELNNRTPRLRELVYRVLQSFRCASRHHRFDIETLAVIFHDCLHVTKSAALESRSRDLL